MKKKRDIPNFLVKKMLLFKIVAENVFIMVDVRKDRLNLFLNTIMGFKKFLK